MVGKLTFTYAFLYCRQIDTSALVNVQVINNTMQSSPNTFLIAFQDGNAFYLIQNSTFYQSLGQNIHNQLVLTNNSNASIVFQGYSMVILGNSLVESNFNTKYLIKFYESLPFVSNMVMRDNWVTSHSPITIYYLAVDN